MNTYYLVRHGQTEWNVLGKTQGHGNSPLTGLGISQARNLGMALKRYPIDMIFCSDLGRAVDTASIVGEILNIRPQPTDALRELGFGIWEGMPLSKIEKVYPDMYRMWRNCPEKLSIPGGEKLTDVKERQDRFIEELNRKFDGKHILLVSHSITVRVMLLSFLDSDVRNIYRIKQDNTAINIVECRSYGPVVTKINDTSHLESSNGGSDESGNLVGTVKKSAMD